MRERLAALRDPRLGPAIVRANALLASWPEPDMLRQVVSRLNQWVDTLEKPAPLAPDPMLATLPAEFRKLPMATEADLGEAHFTAYDGFALMEAVWARDVARWAKGNSSDDLLAARNLFDWTVRNIQLDEDRPNRVPQVPWETLFLGHGTAMERAWTYILLLRQCDIDAAVLALPVTTPAAGKPAAKLTQWCVAVLIGDKDKKLYLFDPGLGLPVPTANGITAAKSGELDVLPATLDQVIANSKLLDRLAGDSDSPYWASKADLKHAAALVEASPLYIEPRAKRMEASLAGERKMVLSRTVATGGAVQSGGRRRRADVGVPLRNAPAPHGDVAAASLFSIAVVPSLHRHWRGRQSLQGPRPAPQRPLLRRKRRHRILPEGTAADARRNGPGSKARPAILHGIDREEKENGHVLTRQSEEELNKAARSFWELCISSVLLGRIDAAYWLGQIEYELGQYDSASSYFDARTLQAAGSTVFWGSGAHYNMARCNEITGHWQDAVQEYEAIGGLYKEPGSLLRAQWLREVHVPKPAEAAKASVKKPQEKGMPEKKRPREKRRKKRPKRRRPLKRSRRPKLRTQRSRATKVT